MAAISVAGQPAVLTGRVFVGFKKGLVRRLLEAKYP